MFLSCPLAKYKFGLQNHHCQPHGVANIPCQNHEETKLSLFQHLHQKHIFNAAAALKIVRAVVLSPDRLDRIDLFSHLSIESIIGNRVLSYVGNCPLFKNGKWKSLPITKISLLYRCLRHHAQTSSQVM